MKLRELERTHRRRLAACFLLIVVTGVVFFVLRGRYPVSG